MTDEARIARLTELARRVYGEGVTVQLGHGGSASWAAYVMRHESEYLMVLAPNERALDMLEAALLAAAGDDLRALLAAAGDDLRARLERLARMYEEAADSIDAGSAEDARLGAALVAHDRCFRDFARELRALLDEDKP